MWPACGVLIRCAGAIPSWNASAAAKTALGKQSQEQERIYTVTLQDSFPVCSKKIYTSLSTYANMCM